MWKRKGFTDLEAHHDQHWEIRWAQGAVKTTAKRGSKCLVLILCMLSNIWQMESNCNNEHLVLLLPCVLRAQASLQVLLCGNFRAVLVINSLIRFSKIFFRFKWYACLGTIICYRRRKGPLDRALTWKWRSCGIQQLWHLLDWQNSEDNFHHRAAYMNVNTRQHLNTGICMWIIFELLLQINQQADILKISPKCRLLVKDSINSVCNTIQACVTLNSFLKK
jgi:hypothetical protein